jgi:folylpolyglutamate synthase
MIGSDIAAQYLSIQCRDVSRLILPPYQAELTRSIEAIRKSGGRLNDFAVLEMHDYLRRIGYQPNDLNKLNVVHITGTKGKGSTSAFTERILRTHLNGKVGLYTSPHLCAVRERIRVNGEPLSEEVFATLFFEVWEKLEGDQKVSLVSCLCT